MHEEDTRTIRLRITSTELNDIARACCYNLARRLVAAWDEAPRQDEHAPTPLPDPMR